MVLKSLLQAILALAILVAAVLGMRHFVLTKPEVPRRPAQEQTYAVETAAVRLASHTPSIRLYGEVTAGRQVDLRSLVAGEIVAVNPELKAGGTVRKGEDLVAINRFDYEGAVREARANLLEARAQKIEIEGRVALYRDNLRRAGEQLAFAERDLERAEQLQQTGSVTERALDERRLLVSQRRQAEEQARNTLAVEEAGIEQQAAVIQRLQWRLELAERNLTNTVLRAPFDAIVRTEAAQAGRLVNVNDVVASLYARNELDVRFTLSDNQYGRLIAQSGTLVARPVDVSWVLGSQTIDYRAVVDRVGADVARTRGGVDVIATVVVEDGAVPLRPGAFVEVTIPDRTYPATARLPETALYDEGHVFVVTEGRMTRRNVRVEAFDQGYVLVSGELSDGDVVVTTRIAGGGEGVKVRSLTDAAQPAERTQGQGGGNGQ
ncbi:efflux RND transporter periplasmic adaptor subunit [Pannonibacter tanglangensis]|uniref:efflux RND transporter periplasmic adaptor subunit n=1 Tax=Pannonibacter tanglangensis TaxID=2750084 RepID=UPI001AD9411A